MKKGLKMGLKVENLNEVLQSGTFEYIENAVNNFKSKNNPDVENFLKKSAVQFCKMKQAVTYLVFDDDTGDLIAYFTLAFKILEFPLENLSKSMLKILERNGNRTENTIQVPGMLLAQWSKNFAFENNIPGSMIMELVRKEFLFVQNKIGGSFAFVECETEKDRLVMHYEKMGFVPVAERLSEIGKPLVQLIKKI